MIFSPDTKRADYNRVKEFLAQKAPGVDFIINHADLRLEKPLDASERKYAFTVRKGTSDRPLENKLDQNDLFIINAIALCITKQDESTTPKRYGNYPLLTFPDPNFFLGNDTVNMEEWEALECVYNGSMVFNTSVLKRATSILTHNFRYAGDFQTWVNGATNNQVNSSRPSYGGDDAKRGYYPLHPGLIIDGADTNSIDVEIGEGNRAQIAGLVNASNAAVNTRNVLVLLLKGFIVPEGAQKVGRWTHV